MHDEEILATPWFRLLARHTRDSASEPPYYCLQTSDFVCIVAQDQAKRLILVKQFRPPINDFALELPGGHVEPGQSPEEAARQELWEETAYRAEKLDLLGCLRPDVGRLTNRLWCFWADGLLPDPEKLPEAGHEVVLYDGPVSKLVNFGLNNCYSLSCIWLAILQKKLS